MAVVRDTQWLMLEACREYQRGTCKRTDSECKYAHPGKSVTVENGRVTACFDSLKGRCTRENCKYLHPPPHLKTQLEINGRNSLAAQKMLQNIQSQQFMHSAAHVAAMQQLPGVLPSAPNIQTAVQAQQPTLSTANSQSSASDAVYLYPAMQLPVGTGHYADDWSKVLYRTASQEPNPVQLQMHHPLGGGLYDDWTKMLYRNATGVMDPTNAGQLVMHRSMPAVPTESEWAGAKLMYGRATEQTHQQTPSAVHGNSIPGAYPYLTHTLPGGMTPNQQAQLIQEMGLQHGQMIPQPGTQLPMGLAKNKNDKLEVCREFQRGNCSRGEQECKFAHPNEQTTIDNTDNTVTVCMDYIKGRCTREKCKYFHPPPHLQAKIKAAQHQANQASVTAVQFPGLVPPTKKPPNSMSPTILNHHHTPGYNQLIQMQLAGQQPSYIPTPGYHHWPGKLGGGMFCGDQMSQMLANESLRQQLHQFPMMPPMPGTPASVPIYAAAHQLVQNQSADTIPVCRDFKSGSCKRPNCKYAHVTEDYVEIIDGKVTLCRYAAQSRCTRPKCKFYHPPTTTGLPMMSSVPIGSLPPVVTSAAV